jgi:hypothetical protein
VLKPWAVATLLFGLFLVFLLGFQVLGPVVPASNLQFVHIGDSKDHVVSVLGKPAESQGSSWIYRRHLNPGWLEIRFDTNDRVVAINDESPLGRSK